MCFKLNFVTLVWAIGWDNSISMMICLLESTAVSSNYIYALKSGNILRIFTHCIAISWSLIIDLSVMIALMYSYHSYDIPYLYTHGLLKTHYLHVWIHFMYFEVNKKMDVIVIYIQYIIYIPWWNNQLHTYTCNCIINSCRFFLYFIYNITY